MDPTACLPTLSSSVIFEIHPFFGRIGAAVGMAMSPKCTNLVQFGRTGAKCLKKGFLALCLSKDIDNNIMQTRGDSHDLEKINCFIRGQRVTLHVYNIFKMKTIFDCTEKI